MHCAVSFDTRPRRSLLRLDGPSPSFPCSSFASSLFSSFSPPPPLSRLPDWYTSLSYLGKGKSLHFPGCQSALLENGSEGFGSESPESW